MSSHASRVWITSARSCSWARPICVGERPALHVAGRVVVVVVEAALPHRHDARARPAGRRGRRARRVASCGWSPTVAHTTPGWRAAAATASADRARSVPTVTSRSTPWRAGRRRPWRRRAPGRRARRRPSPGGSGRRSSAAARAANATGRCLHNYAWWPWRTRLVVGLLGPACVWDADDGSHASCAVTPPTCWRCWRCTPTGRWPSTTSPRACGPTAHPPTARTALQGHVSRLRRLLPRRRSRAHRDGARRLRRCAATIPGAIDVGRAPIDLRRGPSARRPRGRRPRSPATAARPRARGAPVAGPALSDLRGRRPRPRPPRRPRSTTSAGRRGARSPTP